MLFLCVPPPFASDDTERRARRGAELGGESAAGGDPDAGGGNAAVRGRDAESVEADQDHRRRQHRRRAPAPHRDPFAGTPPAHPQHRGPPAPVPREPRRDDAAARHDAQDRQVFQVGRDQHALRTRTRCGARLRSRTTQ
eukprot:306439-Rhodomonas_salina.1